MAKLKKAGLLQTKEGAEGGYRFALDSAEVTLEAIADALDYRFVSAAWRSGDTEMDCLVASGMADIMDGIYGELDALCRKRLSQMTVKEIDTKIFGE